MRGKIDLLINKAVAAIVAYFDEKVPDGRNSNSKYGNSSMRNKCLLYHSR